MLKQWYMQFFVFSVSCVMLSFRYELPCQDLCELTIRLIVSDSCPSLRWAVRLHQSNSQIIMFIYSSNPRNNIRKLKVKKEWKKLEYSHLFTSCFYLLYLSTIQRLYGFLIHHTHQSLYSTVDFAKGLSEFPNTSLLCVTLAETRASTIKRVACMSSVKLDLSIGGMSGF